MGEPMKFQFDGRTFRLEFERKYKNVSVMRGGAVKTTRSKYPYTTATLYEVKDGEEPKVFARGTVGCLPTDKFSNASGRLFALRELSRAVGKVDGTKELRTALWLTYKNRAVRPEIIDPKPVEQPVVSAAPIALKALPPAREGMTYVPFGSNLDSRIIH
jgi:hypothetical protein